MDIPHGINVLRIFDAVNFYPSVKLKLVRKAIEYYARDLTEEDQIKIEHCLEMIKFGMTSTLLNFVDKYYEYDGEKDPEEKGLTIGGYESAWLADLVGAYILANTQQHFKDSKYHGLYRDDGLTVLNGKWNYQDIVNWRNQFQESVNQLAEGDYLQFTCDVWLDKTRRESPEKGFDKNVTIQKGKTFPFLDMELLWSSKGELQFQVHLKPNQELKYLNDGSAHTKACFKAIPNGVYKRLAKLTTITEENKDKKLDELYPKHFKALRKAKLVTKEVPTLQAELQKTTTTTTDKDRDKAKEESDRNRRRSVFFCIGYSTIWNQPIHSMIKEIKQEFNLSWLRFSMAYHRFTNVREIFQGDMSGKIIKGVESKQFKNLSCNCRLGPDRGCGYNNVCRNCVVVY